MATEKSRVPALSRCLEILTYIQNHKQCTKNDLLNDLDLPRSSLYLLLSEMEKQKLIVTSKSGKIQLWVRLIDLGDSAKQNLNLRSFVTPLLQKLIINCEGLAAHFGVFDKTKAYYVVKVDNPKSGIVTMSREGLQISLVHSGIGKCLLAYQKEEIQDLVLDNLDYTPSTKTSITNKRDLKKELIKIREQGWAFDNSEGESEIRCIAVPVFSDDKILLGAISIVGTVSSYTDEKLKDVLKKTQDCAKLLTQKL